MTSKQHTYANFGEYIYWSYANLQMLHYAVTAGKRKYDRMCYMIRSKAFKAYKEWRWNIHDLLEFNVEKIRQNNYCWYCGKELEPSKLTKDHVFPRSKGGDNDMDNIIMVCKTCNSSKGDMDLFEWYAVIMVDTAEEIKHLPCPQPPYLREDIIPRLKAAGKRVARYIGIVERVAVLIFVVGGIGLVILRDAVGI